MLSISRPARRSSPDGPGGGSTGGSSGGSGPFGSRCEGVVVGLDRGAALVESAGRLVRGSWGGALLAAVSRDPLGMPCAGDQVSCRRWPDGRTTLEAVLPRRSLLVRDGSVGRTGSAGGRPQPLAANVDLVAVVEALPDPDPVRLGRLLALARSSGALPLVVLTKADLLPAGESAHGPAADLDPVPEVERMAGCPVRVVSARTGAGLAELAAALTGRTTALLGAPGAGRSTLLAALAERDLLQLWARRSRRRRPPASRELHQVAGGAVIDGPALRAVWPAMQAEAG